VKVTRAKPGGIMTADAWNQLADLAERTEALAEENRILSLDAQLRLRRGRRFLFFSVVLTVLDLALLGRTLLAVYG
jgi:hypothetical protein